MTTKDINNKIDAAADKAKELNEKAAYHADKLADKGQKLVNEGADKAADSTKGVGDQVKETAGKVSNKAQEIAERVTDQLGGAVAEQR